MPIELDRDVREEAVQSIQRYFSEHMEERIGNIQAGALLSFFLEEIRQAPIVPGYHARIPSPGLLRFHVFVARILQHGLSLAAWPAGYGLRQDAAGHRVVAHPVR
nr:DUF2164 domain-containing protein [uncultured Ralstonia sp.]